MSRRDQIKMSEAEVEAFLAERHTLQVATIGSSGHPHLVAMWYGFLDGQVAFWTYARSQKILNLQRDPKMTCLVEAGEDYAELRGVELVGLGRVVEDRDAVQAIGESVYERYTSPIDDAGREIVRAMGAKRAAVVLDVERTVTWDHRKLGGGY
ncbi:MAG: pyridoxamine 5'-phosphate oxidase family protein [Acidimicrobiales bacterium]